MWHLSSFHSPLSLTLANFLGVHMNTLLPGSWWVRGDKEGGYMWSEAPATPGTEKTKAPGSIIWQVPPYLPQRPSLSSLTQVSSQMKRTLRTALEFSFQTGLTLAWAELGSKQCLSSVPWRIQCLQCSHVRFHITDVSHYKGILCNTF